MKKNQVLFVLLTVISIVAGVLTAAAVLLVWPLYIPIVVIALQIVATIALAASIQGSERSNGAALAEAVNSIAKGNFSAPQNGDSERDDVYFSSVYSLAAELKKFTDDINQTLKKYNGGNLNVKLEEKNYEGAYREAVKNINSAVANSAKDLDSFTEAIRNIASGEFRNTLARQIGDKEKIFDAFDALITVSKKMLSEINGVKQAVSEGRLSFKIDNGKLNGEWSKGVSQLNEALSFASAPVKELQNVGDRLSRGELGNVSSLNYKGDYADVFRSFEQALGVVSLHNKEVLAIFEELARYTPGRSSAREYGGSFPQFKQAVSAAYENLGSLAASGSPKPTVKADARRTTGVQRTGVSPGSAAAVRSASAKPVVSKLSPSASTSSASVDSFVDAKPNLGNKTLKAPSAAKVYDAKDFGKY